MMARLMAWGRALGPARAAFIGSLLLSLIAVSGGSLINRDGILYVETAQAILDLGMVTASRQGLDWQFMPLLMAGLHTITGLHLEAAAHLLNAIFMAGACGLVAAISRRRSPDAAWLACLVVLSMPAYNGYRNEILREFGFWCFSLLTIWLAMRWEELLRWREAIFCQLALAFAALFRLEAVAFYPALMLWQFFSVPAGRRMQRVFMMGSLPLAATVLAAALFGSGLVPLPTRIPYYLEAANPLHKLQVINEAASRMSDTVFKFKYSREEAGYILFFGLLSVIPMKFLKMSGVFLVPMVYQLASQPLRAVLARWQPLPWVFLAYLLVLAAFITHQFFLVGRYVSLLNLLAVPVVAAGLFLLMQRFPRWKALLLALALLTMAANVVSLSPKKTHVVEAGRWLAAKADDSRRVGVDSARLAYYAGWKTRSAFIMEREGLAKALADKRVDMVAIEVSRKDTEAEKWLAEHRLERVQRFTNKAGDTVIVAVPAQH